jgi:hypothetical protein
MKAKLTISVLMIFAAASVASAQVLPANPPNLPPSQPPMPGNPNPAVPSMPIQPVAQPGNISAGTAAGASAGAPGMVTSPVNRPDPAAPTEANVSGDARVGATTAPQHVTAGSNSQVTLDNRVSGLTAPAVVTGESSASLRSDETVRAIQSTRFNTRDQITANIQERLNATSSLLAELRNRANTTDDTSRAAFARALGEVRQREQNLQASLRAATKASSESSWGAAQSQLAQDYSAYARAVTEAEVAARAGK